MPIKWTPENDQLLLLKILETSAVQADVRGISAAWPTDKGETPTPRAISERLVKIRSLAKANGAGHFAVSSAQSKSAKGIPTPSATPTATPRKRKAATNGTTGGKTPKRGAKKAKNDGEEGKDSVEDFENGVKIQASVEGSADGEDEEDCVMVTPSKKVKMEASGMDFEQISGMIEKFGGGHGGSASTARDFHEDAI